MKKLRYICEVISLRRVFDTSKFQQDYAENTGEIKISESHIIVRVKLSFGIIYSRILCICLRKFRVNWSGSFCFIVLQNQLTPSLIDNFWKEKIFIATHLIGPYEILMAYFEKNPGVIKYKFLGGFFTSHYIDHFKIRLDFQNTPVQEA